MMSLLYITWIALGDCCLCNRSLAQPGGGAKKSFLHPRQCSFAKKYIKSELPLILGSSLKRQRQTYMPRNIAKSKYWMVTLNNPGDWIPTLVPGVVYVTGQREVGESGTPHWQLFFALERQQRSSWLHNNIHARAACFGKTSDAVDDCIAYVTKEETRAADPIDLGVRPSPLAEQGRRTDLDRARQAVMEERMTVSQLWIHHSSVMMRYSRAMIEFRSRYLESLVPREEIVPRPVYEPTKHDLVHSHIVYPFASPYPH